MDETTKYRISATEQLRIEAHERLTAAQRAMSEKPADRNARAVYVGALDEMRKAADLTTRSPELQAAFDRARHGAITKKEPGKAAPKLEFRPPGPSPMGGEQARPALVSPQLREEERDEVREKALRAMRVSAEFRKASRDPFER